MGKTIAEKRRKMILVNQRTVLFGFLLLNLCLSEGTNPVDSISFVGKSKIDVSEEPVEVYICAVECCVVEVEATNRIETAEDDSTFLMPTLEQDCPYEIKYLRKGQIMAVFAESEALNPVDEITLNMESINQKFECSKSNNEWEDFFCKKA